MMYVFGFFDSGKNLKYLIAEKICTNFRFSHVTPIQNIF